MWAVVVGLRALVSAREGNAAKRAVNAWLEYPQHEEISSRGA